MKTNTINLSIPKELLRDVDLIAEKENRNRSELLREALVRLVRSRSNWDWAVAHIRAQTKRAGITPKDIEEAIREVRRG